jgi:hypothetical protein
VISQPIRKGAPHTVEPLTGRPRPCPHPCQAVAGPISSSAASRVHRYWPKPPRRCASYAPALVFATPDQPQQPVPSGPADAMRWFTFDGQRTREWWTRSGLDGSSELGQAVIVRGDTGPPTSRTPLPMPSSRFAGFSATSTDVSDTNTRWQHPPSTSLADAGRPLSHRASAHNYCTY